MKDGLYYKKFTDVPFTGKVSGEYDKGFDEGSFKKGLWTGLWKSFYSNGQLKSKGNYKDGFYLGEWVEYTEYGSYCSKVITQMDHLKNMIDMALKL